MYICIYILIAALLLLRALMETRAFKKKQKAASIFFILHSHVSRPPLPALRGSLLPFYLRANANILLESNQGVCGELDVSLERALARCQPARKTARLPKRGRLCLNATPRVARAL